MPLGLVKLALIFAISAIPAIAFSQPGVAISEEQKKALSAVERMTAAFHQGDIEGVMASYEPDATVVFEPGAPIKDPAVLRQMFQGAFTLKPQFEYAGHEVFVLGDTAVHFAPWSMTGKSPDGMDVTDSGLSVAVLRKQPDGHWLMIFDNPHGQRLMEN